MKPVDQTVFGADGNCFSAVVASLLELPVAEVPTFHTMGGSWWSNAQRWLAKRGLTYIVFDVRENWPCEIAQDLYHEIAGKSNRGRMHSVVGRGGKTVHDPHPSRDGLETITEFGFVIPLDVASSQSPNEGSQ